MRRIFSAEVSWPRPWSQFQQRDCSQWKCSSPGCRRWWRRPRRSCRSRPSPPPRTRARSQGPGCPTHSCRTYTQESQRDGQWRSVAQLPPECQYQPCLASDQSKAYSRCCRQFSRCESHWDSSCQGWRGLASGEVSWHELHCEDSLQCVMDIVRNYVSTWWCYWQHTSSDNVATRSGYKPWNVRRNTISIKWRYPGICFGNDQYKLWHLQQGICDFLHNLILLGIFGKCIKSTTIYS